MCVKDYEHAPAHCLPQEEFVITPPEGDTRLSVHVHMFSGKLVRSLPSGHDTQDPFVALKKLSEHAHTAILESHLLFSGHSVVGEIGSLHYTCTLLTFTS